MELDDRKLDEEQLRTLSTGELVRHALDEARLLVKAEVLHAKKEMKQEIAEAKVSGIFLGGGLVLALCGLPLFFVAIALALPLKEPIAAVIVGAALLIAGGLLAFLGVKSLPRKPLPHTQDRLKKDLQLTREQLQ